MKEHKKLTIMVSSTVYGIEELLDRIYTLLTAFGYDVWMSHRGTVPVFSSRSAFENCIAAVDDCDLFLGLITPIMEAEKMGMGYLSRIRIEEGHRIEQTAGLLVHDHVVFARSLLCHLGYGGAAGRGELSLEKNQILDDLRVIDMYEEAILSERPLRDRQGNWVQKFRSDGDAALFATAQFSRYQEVEAFVKENFRDSAHVSRTIQDRRGRS